MSNEELKSMVKREEAMYRSIAEIFKGNRAAVDLFWSFSYIANLWDDLIDKDHPAEDERINRAFYLALVGLPTNPFYVEHAAVLVPLIENIILKWQDATALENGSDEHGWHLAYGLRAGLLELIGVMARLIGGYEWATFMGPKIRLLNEERLSDFLDEMRRNLHERSMQEE